MQKYDFVVVGAGMFGATFARCATDKGKRVLVIEKRSHIGGNCYTEDRNGIIFHKYGPHVFHTNNDQIWEFVNRFAQWEPYITRTKVITKQQLYSFPINLATLTQLWGVSTQEEAVEKLNSVKIPNIEQDNIEGWVLANLGREIYDKFIYGYTVKQWGRDPRLLPANIVKRLPIRTINDDNYFIDRYQAMPIGGYTPMFEKMLDGIEVRLNCDYFADSEIFNNLGRIVYSGRIDAFFDYCEGPLEFRSCHFNTDTKDSDYQSNAVINYADIDVAYTRIVEHKHFYKTAIKNSLITYEYPFECSKVDNPLYPINDRKNTLLYLKYKVRPTSAIIGGRCGSYKYLDMCEAIAQAIKLTGGL
jgi:UDP-galactopyranose mutase